MVTIKRSDWEQRGYHIVQHTNSPPFDLDVLENVTIHYPGGGSYPLAPSDSWCKSYAAAMQKDYVDSRGYSIGYNMCVTQNGKIIQLRDTTWKCAANGTKAGNLSSFAIQIAAPIGQPASDMAIHAVRREVARLQELAGRELRIVGHRDHKPTACPGAEIYAQIEAGLFNVDFGGPVPSEPDPEPDPEPAADEVLWTRVVAEDGYWSIARRVYSDGSVSDNARALSEANDGRPLFTGQLIPVPGRAVL